MRLLHLCILAALIVPLLTPSPVTAAARKPSEPPWPHAESSSSREVRAWQTAWHNALAEHRKGRNEKAIRILEKLEGGDSLSSLYRSVLLAGFHIAAGEPARADARLAAALHQDREGGSLLRDPVWLRHVYRMRLRNSLKLPQAVRSEVLHAALAAPLEKVDRTEVLYQLLALDTSVVPRAARAVHLRQLIPLALPGPRLDAVYRRWLAEASPEDTAWEAQKLVLDLEEALGLWTEAIARARSLHGRVPSPELARILQGKISLWYYNKGSYAESIKEYVIYRDRHGDTPEVLLQIARAHRAQSHDAPARAAYSRLVARFPRDARAAETLWMYAFDDEMLGRTDTALAAYARIARDFPQNPRSGEAMFRSGLIHYRTGEFAEASGSFAELRLARKSGRLTGAARYWEGKSLAAQADTSGAKAVWASLIREYPFGHYGHLARRELARVGGVPDSLAWSRVLNRATGDSLKTWLTVALAGTATEAGFGESSWLPVNRLFALGLDTLAVLTLQARANAAPANLWLVYDAAVRCREAGFGYEAYRFAMRLSDRLPLEQWPAAPVDVLRLFYPPSYAELVRPEAARAGVSPALVLALIKQESGFDPAAVSRVGARGLMQLMPTTGTEQARKEGMRNFHPDSLFDPAVNVRLGVAYLRDVLRRHDGNIDHALAHYNAGPTALARWMPRLEGRPPEDAVEDIGYAETREYVKRVSANLKTYEVLWEDKGNEK